MGIQNVGLKNIIPEANTDGLILDLSSSPYSRLSITDRLERSINSNIGIASIGNDGANKALNLAQLSVPSHLLDRLAGQIVVELGANSSEGFSLALSLGAGSYVGVDPFFSDLLDGSIRAIICEDGKEIYFSILPEDARSALQRLPSSSVSIFCLGFSGYILPSQEYADCVTEEITRVLHPNGVGLFLNSNLVPKQNGINVSEFELNSDDLFACAVKDSARC